MLMEDLKSTGRSHRDVVSDAEIRHFRENGFVIPAAGLPEEDTLRMREAIEQILLDNPDWHGIVRMPHVPLREGQIEGLIGGEALFRIAIHPTIIEAACRLVGPNLILWGGEIFAKPAGIGKRTPWHQDCYNPTVKPGPGRDRALSAQVWIAVDDVDASNGGLRFIAGSGRQGRLDHGASQGAADLLNFEIDTSGFGADAMVDSVLPSGHFSVHDLYVVHGANANVSGRRRIGLTFHYMAAEDIYDRSFGDAIGSGRDRPAPLALRPIWLVLGENRAAANDFTTGHQNLGDLDDLAETARRQLTGRFT